MFKQSIFIYSKNKTDDEGYDSDLNSISLDNEKITLSTTEKEDTVNLLQKLPSGEFPNSVTVQIMFLIWHLVLFGVGSTDFLFV